MPTVGTPHPLSAVWQELWHQLLVHVEVIIACTGSAALVLVLLFRYFDES